MPYWTLCFGAGKKPTLDAKYTFFLRSRTLLANGSAYSLTVAEMTNLVESCIEKTYVTIYLIESGLVKEHKSMTFEAFEFLVPLHLHLEVL